jgi:hypothetical protein
MIVITKLFSDDFVASLLLVFSDALAFALKKTSGRMNKLG